MSKQTFLIKEYRDKILSHPRLKGNIAAEVGFSTRTIERWCEKNSHRLSSGVVLTEIRKYFRLDKSTTITETIEVKEVA